MDTDLESALALHFKNYPDLLPLCMRTAPDRIIAAVTVEMVIKSDESSPGRTVLSLAGVPRRQPQPLLSIIGSLTSLWATEGFLDLISPDRPLCVAAGNCKFSVWPTSYHASPIDDGPVICFVADASHRGDADALIRTMICRVAFVVEP